MSAAARLRLVAASEFEPVQAAEERLYSSLIDLYRLKGFTHLHHTVTGQLERLSKANRSDLAAEGWIA